MKDVLVPVICAIVGIVIASGILAPFNIIDLTFKNICVIIWGYICFYVIIRILLF